ncbi:hypothetical protein SDC9_108475 [bioreactor metagenome]|uniref:Uncharacterized protein n=1 Tax=bioreactor metagenome TaxID=1076179 RepID=A0A645B876_9ZZZZ
MKQKRAISYETHRRAALRSPLPVQYGRLFQSARTRRRDPDADGNRHGDPRADRSAYTGTHAFADAGTRVYSNRTFRAALCARTRHCDGNGHSL